MVNGPPCQKCGWTLRWFAEHHSWGCDRCRVMFPAQPVAAPVMAPPGPPPVGPAPVGAPPMMGAPMATVAPARAKKSSKLPLILVGSAVAIGGAVAAVLLLRGGGGGVGSKDDIVKQSVAAMAAGDADALAKLADVETLMDKAIDCSKRDAKDEDDLDPAKEARKLRRRFEREAEKTKGMSIEVVEIEKEPDAKDDDKKKRSTKFLEKGDKAGKGCVAKVDVAMHRVKAKLKVKQGDKPARDGLAEVQLIELDGRWFLVDPPRIKAGAGCEAAVAHAMKDSRKDLQKLPSFSDAMMGKLEEAALRRCRVDAWSEEAIECMVDEDRVSSIDFCFKKLSGEHQKALEAEMMRVAGLGKGSNPDPTTPVTPPTRPTVDDPPPPDPGLPEDGLAAVGMPDCEAYRQAMLKLVACSLLPAATRDLYKRALTSLTTSWANISGTTATAVKKSMNDMCRRGIGTLKSSSSADCL